VLFLEAFKEFPPRQKPGSFSMDQALQRMNEVASSAGHRAERVSTAAPEDVGAAVTSAEDPDTGASRSRRHSSSR
jgi:hypothetical protein